MSGRGLSEAGLRRLHDVMAGAGPDTGRAITGILFTPAGDDRS
ncbi:MAG: hypothetical protein P4L20_11500 [Acidimicrobiales bacterium]|nr:hypothetical protein [Acidimicrobiales bacterium]